MKTLYLLTLISAALILTSCASTDAVHPTPNKSSPSEQALAQPKQDLSKNPLDVSFVAAKKPLNVPYQVIGKASVSQYNMVGIKRQEATIRDIMRQLAASLNGDALIDLERDHHVVTAKVVAYKRVMV